MSATNFTLIRFASSPDDIVDLALTAREATEGPQILLEWEAIDADVDGFRIVRRRDHSPMDETDGDVVYAALRIDTETSYADTLVLSEEVYYYRAFVKIDGQWFAPASSVPDKDAQDWAFSGTRLAFEDVEGTATLDSNFSPHSTLESEALAGVASVGDWFRVGRGSSSVVGRIMEVLDEEFGIFRVEVPRDKDFPIDEEVMPDPVILEELTFTNGNPSYSSDDTIVRVDGSFVEDGYTVLTTVVVTNSENNDYVSRVPIAVYSKVLVFSKFADKRLADEGPTQAACIHPAWTRQPGEAVTLLRPVGPFLSRKLYEDLPANITESDEKANQRQALEETELSDGSKVNLYSPGIQLGLERWLRSLSLELSKAHAAANYRITMRDLQRAPIDYVRRFASNYGYEIPESITDDHLTRVLAYVQPALAKYRGREDSLRTWIRILTGQVPTVVYGKNRVIRFGEAESGFAWSGYCVVDAIDSGTDFSVDTDAWGTFPEWLEGGKLYLLDDPDVGGEYTYLADIESVSGSTMTLLATLANPTPTDDLDDPYGDGRPAEVVVASPALYSPVAGPVAFVDSFYDPEVIEGRSTVFNDRGMIIYLPAELSEERDLLAGHLRDVSPLTVSLLVYAALELSITLA